MQFGRNPPMLNNWAFNELVLTDTSDMPHRFTKLGMVSTFFVKLINSTQGRLAGTRILRHLAKTITTSIKTEPGKYAPVLISKVGGSFYLALREDSAQDFSHNLAGKLNRTFQTVKFLSRKEPHEDYDSGTFKQFLFRLATRLPIYTTQPIYSATRPSGRTLSELGNTYDTLRHTQYLEETAIAHRYYQYYLDKHPEISTLWQAFLAERPERRHQDLLFIDPETTPIFGEFIRQYFGEFAPLPQPN
jgi:hypothetical protein